jgi:hypothetical protein
MKERFNRLQWINVVAFLIVPAISSLVSTYHIVDFFQLGNFTSMAILLAVAFELGAIASALSLTMFIVLTLFQMIGNVYYTYSFIVTKEVTDATWLSTAIDFLNYFSEWESFTDQRMFLSMLIGIPIPLISLAFLKTLVDYVGNSDSKDTVPYIDEEEEEKPDSLTFDVDTNNLEDSEENLEKLTNKFKEVIELDDEEPQEEEVVEEVVENPREETLELGEDDFENIELNEDDKEEEEIEDFEISSEGIKKVEEPDPQPTPKPKPKETKLVGGDSIVVEDNNLPALKKKREEDEKKKLLMENEKMKAELKKLYPQTYGKTYDK